MKFSAICLSLLATVFSYDIIFVDRFLKIMPFHRFQDWIMMGSNLRFIMRHIISSHKLSYYDSDKRLV